MKVLFIDIDDSQNKSAYEEVIAFYNGCENLTTHHCKTVIFVNFASLITKKTLHLPKIMKNRKC